MPSIGPAGPRLIRALARCLVALFYRRVDVVGVGHVPPTGPVIVAANHQNALVDPMLLLAAVPRTLVPLAKAPLFHHPIIGPFIRLAGAIPVTRRQDVTDGGSGRQCAHLRRGRGGARAGRGPS